MRVTAFGAEVEVAARREKDHRSGVLGWGPRSPPSPDSLRRSRQLSWVKPLLTD